MNSTKQNRVDSGISNPVNLLTKRTADFTSISKPITTILIAYYAVLTSLSAEFCKSMAYMIGWQLHIDRLWVLSPKCLKSVITVS